MSVSVFMTTTKSLNGCIFTIKY